MAKKVYDIMPPKVANKVPDTIKEISAKPAAKPRKQKVVAPVITSIPPGSVPPAMAPQQPAPTPPSKRRFPLIEIVVGIAIIVVLVGVYLYGSLQKVDIQISPRIDTVNIQDSVAIDASATTVDVSKKIIPARTVQVQKNSWQEFPATGMSSDNGKASGTITVYNKISPATPLVLKIGTHFLSDAGKYFVTTQKITVPAMQKSTAGSIDVPVEAEDVGSDYNIGPSKFSIPKLSGTSYYYSVWAESTSTLAGGYSGTKKQVTDDDIKNAQASLTKTLLDQAQSELKNKLSSDDVVLNGAITTSVLSASPNVKSKAVVDVFDESASVNVTALVFKRQDIEAIIKQDINGQLTGGKKILDSTLPVTYNPDSIDVQGGKAAVHIQSNVKLYQQIDTNSLVDLFTLKSADEIKNIVTTMYQDSIANVKVQFWPFWANHVPSDRNRVKIDLHF